MGSKKLADIRIKAYREDNSEFYNLQVKDQVLVLSKYTDTRFQPEGFVEIRIGGEVIA